MMTLDREELRKAAANRRSDEAAPSDNKVRWDCGFCSRGFLTENGFMSHFCKEREKMDLLKSPQGQAAYQFYSEWMRLKRHSIPAPDRFMSSKYFNQFVKFVEWSEKVAIPVPASFIKLMVETNVLPSMWCRSNTYEMYLTWFDNVYPPESQFLESLDKIKEIAADEGCTPGEVYEKIGVRELIKLIRRRKLSPWLMITSSRFLTWAQALPQTDRDDLNTAINFLAYANKLNANPALARILKAACDDEHL